MSTAIMQSGAFYDFGELLLKNNSRNMVHLQQQQQQQQQALSGNNATQSAIGAPAHVNQTNISANNNNNAAIHSLPNIQGSNNVSAAQMLQTQINVAAVMQQQQQHQQQNQQKNLHNALTRTASHQPSSTEMLSWVSSMMEINAGQHRKLERTQSEPAPQVNTSRYKTELCRPFEEAGVCKYAEKCQFAHGAHELRNLQRHPKYKTEYCRTFHSVGFCPYGPRCHFVHNEEDAPIPSARNGGPASNGNPANTGAAGTFGNNRAANAGHQLPMSPPLSMSTGSDRASPTGSLSPTNSMSSFPFPDQSSPIFVNGPQSFGLQSMNRSSVLYSTSSLQISPPASPPVNSTSITPPPTPTILSMAITQPATTVKLAGGAAAATNVGEDTRLPIFNHISCLDALKNLAM